MNIERKLRRLPDRSDNRRTERDVWHKVSIHDIHVKHVSAGFFDPAMSSPSAAKFADRIDGAMPENSSLAHIQKNDIGLGQAVSSLGFDHNRVSHPRILSNT